MALAFATDAGAVTPDVAAADVASRFPAYEVTGTIGRGGMGVVFRARQRALDREVALKVLPGGAARPAGFTERFAREARALARLQHPGIVQIFDFGTSADGWCFLAMELVEGVNLRKMLADGRIPPKAALAIVPQICDALQYAHDHGVVHRDIKPENVLVTPDGRVKIADFGLAKLVLEARGALLTQTGVAMGTPLYMAPEQVERPADVDHRADIYSLGVVFYEMLTGELPLGRFAPPSKKSDVDARIDDIVLKTLEKERDARFQRVAEVRTKIDEAGVPPPLVPPPPSVPPPPLPSSRGPRFLTSAADRAADVHVAHFVSPGPQARISKLALAIPVFAAIAFVTVGENCHSVAQTLMFTAPVLLGLLALSLVAWGRIRKSEGRRYGTGYAGFGVMAALVLAVATPFVVASRRTNYEPYVIGNQIPRFSEAQLAVMRADQDAIRRLAERALALRPVTDAKRFDDFYTPEDAEALRALPEATRTARGDAGQLGLPLASDEFLGDPTSYTLLPATTSGPDARDSVVQMQSAGCVVTAKVVLARDEGPAGRPARTWRFSLAPLLRSGTSMRSKPKPQFPPARDVPVDPNNLGPR
jgi:serine/threonine protein kinase